MAQEITQILDDWKNGDESAVDRLFPFVYDELKKRAKAYLQNERNNHTLQPTALVNEAYLRLVDVNNIDWQNRVHFFAVASNIMRRILVEHARALNAQKRGGNHAKIPLDDIQISIKKNANELLNIDEALKKLSEIDERKSLVVEMKFFGGMNQKEIASYLDVAPRTIQRDWKFAKLWLYRELTKETI